MFASLKQLADTLLAIVHTRLELLSTEFEEARVRLGLMLAYACAALFCLGIAVLLLVVFVIAWFWDTYRLQSLAGLFGLFVATGLLALNALRRQALGKPRLFAASLAELSKDREQLARRE